MVDNGDGTITLRTAITGVPEKITQANGKPMIMDVGRLVFVSVIDYNGTPANADDDVMISQSSSRSPGRTPSCKVTSRCSARSWFPRSPRRQCRTSCPRGTCYHPCPACSADAPQPPGSW